MPGGRVEMSFFDGAKKSDWFFADLNGLAYTWTVMVLLAMFSSIFLEAFMGFDVRWLLRWAGFYWGEDTVFCVLLVGSFVPPFATVFVARVNFTVIGGPRRQFGYVLNWL